MFIVRVRVEVHTTSYPYQPESLTTYLYCKSNKMHQCLNLFYFLKTLYMFRTVFLSSSGEGTIWNCSSISFPLANRQQCLFDICLLLCVQS